MGRAIRTKRFSRELYTSNTQSVEIKFITGDFYDIHLQQRIR
jgi:hypothetical protein